MSNARKADNAFTLNDYTDELLMIPNEWGLINSLGLFDERGTTKHTIEFDETNGSLVLLQDKPRGERANFSKSDYSKLHAVPVPHFNVDDAIKPEDVQGRRRKGTADQDEMVADVRARKMMRIRKSWAATMEFARSKALQGEVYAPNGTVSLNWYTEMNVAQKTVDMVLGTAGTDVIAKGESIIAHIQDNIMSGEMIDEILVLCSPEIFSALIAHPTIAEAYGNYSSLQEPLRNRLGRGKFRTFDHGGLTYIEYRGSFTDAEGNTQKIIPAGEAYAIPLGTSDMFITYFSPANKFQYVNTVGESQYMFEYENGTDTEITIETESNMINCVKRPQAVVKVVSTA